MVLVEAYLDMWRNYANFKGRTSRGGYWFAVLANIIVAFVLGFLSGMVEALSILTAIYSLAILIPGISICVRRLHDIGKSGWFYFINFVPAVGSIILLIFLCKEGEATDNQYGSPVA